MLPHLIHLPPELRRATLLNPPNEALEHTHRTLHFEGTELQLDAIFQRTLGVRLADVHSFNR
jgi:hypothetical protein